MDEAEFLRLEFTSLREEIRETKARIFKLAGVGLVGMPGGYFVAATYDVEILMLTLPALICILLLLYLAESHALMRCGSYIKCVVECRAGREAAPAEGCEPLGWEHWLESTPKGERNRRIVDIFGAVFFHLLFGVYYVASVELATATAFVLWGIVGYSVVLATYLSLGILSVVFLAINFRHIIRTERTEETAGPQAEQDRPGEGPVAR